MKSLTIAYCMTSQILFHQFKHHLQFIRAWMAENKGKLDPKTIQTIKTFGSSQLDMYCGKLCVDEILQQISTFLQQCGITDTTQYKQWVDNGYRLCTLSDDCRFTLRYINHAKPIHIHPARHAPHTMRIKANALKSVVCYLLMYDDANDINMAALNTLRKQHLGLSPVSEVVGIDEMRRVAKALATNPSVCEGGWG
jgi:hypothetical protein